MQEIYEVFGLTPDASDEQINERYQELKAKYSEDRFLEGEAGNTAAKKLTELERAYAEIKSMRSEPSAKAASGNTDAFVDVERNIRAGNFNAAQEILDSFSERNAEWHYLQSVIFYKKNWTNESKKQLEIAMQMDASCEKYRRAYDKLNAKTQSEQAQFSSGTQGGGYSGQPYRNDDGNQQMGGGFCTETWNCCANFLMCNLLLNCCCNCN